VLGGDHKQLPPVVLSTTATARLLQETVFARLREQKDSDGFCTLLTVQHRMPEALMAFPSHTFYDDKLTAHDSVKDAALAVPLLFPMNDSVFDFIDTVGASFDERGDQSKDNPEEARVLAVVVAHLRDAGVPASDIGIISPYAAQVSTLHAVLSSAVDDGLEIDSVDGFQGREKRVIVLSTVRSNESGEVGFLRDARRLNVAITRAREKLIVIGDSATLSSDPLWSRFVDHAIACGAHRSVFDFSI
jgi:ATP-dependent RNA/DNA helicase IGHMBP2